jgi:hypothetical protein
MLSSEEIKKLSRKELADLLNQICTDYSNELYFKHDVDFAFDHYDSDLKVVYVRESEKTENPKSTVEYKLVYFLKIFPRELLNGVVE